MKVKRTTAAGGLLYLRLEYFPWELRRVEERLSPPGRSSSSRVVDATYLGSNRGRPDAGGGMQLHFAVSLDISLEEKKSLLFYIADDHDIFF